MGLPGSFLFLDESGDPGRGPGGSPALVVAILHLESEAPLSRLIKRVRQRERRRKSGKRHLPPGEIKWNLSPPEIREAVLRELVRDSGLISGVSAGFAVKTSGGPWGPDLYRKVATAALTAGMVLDTPASEKRIRLTVDGPPSNITAFFSWLSVESFPTLTVRAADSEAVPELQAVDFVAGAVFTAVFHREARYLNILENGGILLRITEA